MMAIDHKALKAAKPIDLTRAESKRDRTLAERLLGDRLMAAAAQPVAAESPWYVLETRNRAEKDVENSLQAAGVEVWLPMKKGDPSRRGCRPVASRKAILMPAFPGYIFVHAPVTSASVAGLLSVKHVISILGGAERPSPVASKLVNKLRQMIDDGWLDQTISAKALRKGDQVSVKDGPFAWLEGVMEGYVGTAHVRVLIAILGREVPVTVGLAQITKSD